MPQTREEISSNLGERLCWQVARRDDTRVARRLYRKELVDGVYPLDTGAVQVRHGVCQRGAAKRRGPRTTGPVCPEALANNLVKLDLRALERLFNGIIRAVAKAGVFQAKVTGIVDGTDLETAAQYEGCGQVTRKRQMTDKRGRVREIEVTVYGWKVIVLIDAATKIPLAVTVVPIQEHETLSLRALVAQARTNLAGHACLHKVVFDRGFLAGTDLWGLDQHGILFVVPAKAGMAVTADARALAAAGDGMTVGRRVHTIRHGQGREAWSERRRPRWWVWPG
jgi:Transposase DDE domain